MKMSERPYYSYSWENFKRDISMLADKIGQGKYKYILAVTKGGLVPAYYLADLLNIKVIKTISLSSYNGETKGSVVHNRVDGFSEDILRNHKDWLVIDDIVDSGDTLKYIRDKYGNIATATLFKRPSSESPTYYIQESNDWVRFPWERRT